MLDCVGSAFFALAPASVLAADKPSYEVETLKLEGGNRLGNTKLISASVQRTGQERQRLCMAAFWKKTKMGISAGLPKIGPVEDNVFTFTLYDGLTFHDGDDLTTEDVAFSLDYYKEFPPVSNSLGTGEDYLVESYEIIDDQTISITAEEVSADTLSSLGSFKIIPKHIWENVDDPYTYTGDGYLTGSGAYMCTSYDAASGSYEFTAFDNFVPM